MSSILLDPHGDDAVLFASYICQRERPYVVVTHRTVPFEEVALAANQLGCEVSSIISDNHKALAGHLSHVYGEASHVYAPAVHPEGHDEHNEVGRLADEIFPGKVTHYLTYAPRGVRSDYGVVVEPTFVEIAHKFLALACFHSQIELETTRPWFYDLLDMREWITP